VPGIGTPKASSAPVATSTTEPHVHIDESQQHLSKNPLTFCVNFKHQGMRVLGPIFWAKFDSFLPSFVEDERGSLPDLHATPAMTARVYDRNRIVKRSAL